MVTKDEALKLALEALTATMSTHGFQKHIDQAKDDAITAIKQSLAAPVQDTEAHYKSVIEGVQKLFDEKRAQPAPVQEPTVWTATRLWNRRGLWTCPADIERDLLEGYATPPAAPVQQAAAAITPAAQPADTLMNASDEERAEFAQWKKDKRAAAAAPEKGQP